MHNNTNIENTAVSKTHYSSASLTPNAIILPILALLSILILLIPLRFHYRAHNTGAWALCLVIILENFLSLINVLIWPRANFDGWFNGNILCDIEVKLLAPLGIAYHASLCCIVRSLARVLDVERPDLNPTRNQRRRRVWTDLGICFGIPLVCMCTLYVVQNTRYLISAVSGCRDTYDASWPTVVLVFMWPMLFVLGTLYYTSKPPLLTPHHTN